MDISEALAFFKEQKGTLEDKIVKRNKDQKRIDDSIALAMKPYIDSVSKWKDSINMAMAKKQNNNEYQFEHKPNERPDLIPEQTGYLDLPELMTSVPGFKVHPEPKKEEPKKDNTRK